MEDPAWSNLLEALASLDKEDRISMFEIVPTSYKQLAGGSNIRANILLPKSAVEARDPTISLPIIVRIHGGYLVRRHSFAQCHTFIMY